MSALEPTLCTKEALAQSWDAVIVGAGPAGAAAAIAAAQRSLRVLLIDKCRFPRFKCCGGCLNQAALSVLEHLGVGDLHACLGAATVSRMQIAAGGRCADFALPPSLAVSRTVFDPMLIRHAITHGAHFLDQTAIHIHQGTAMIGEHALNARVIIVSDGLKGTSLTEQHAPNIASDARLGVGVMLDEPSEHYPTGVIHMACDKDGYVGMVRVEEGQLNLAAAIDATAIARHGTITRTLQHIIEQAGLVSPSLPATSSGFHGVGALTRRRKRWWAPNVLIIGDAAGYIEPFTGEGMAWAMAGGVYVVPFMQTIIKHGWQDAIGQQWQAHWQRQLAPRQRLCKRIAWALRNPALTTVATRILQCWPNTSGIVTRQLNRPWPLESINP
jgi:flavin-dependent dehydrogenase